MKKALLLVSLLAIAAVGLSGHPAPTAGGNCSFLVNGNTMELQGDCWTDQTILVPDGTVMDLADNTIVALDPSGGHFMGAVVRNAGAWAGVKNGTITTNNLANFCDVGNERLRGVMFDGAAGFVNDLTVDNINQGASGCQEGNAIEIRNAPFDGTGTNPLIVEIGGNVLTKWQKTGIVANGNVNVWVHHNVINGSATQANLAANSLQAGFGGKVLAEHNHIAGNSWGGASDYVATAILMYASASGSVVRQNILIEGNADVGIYVFADGATIDNNKVFESGEDRNQFGYDIGIADYGSGNSITNNKAKGYATMYEGVVGGKNKEIHSPSKQ